VINMIEKGVDIAAALPRVSAFYAQWQKQEQRDSVAWTNWPLFTVGMMQRGYSDVDIQKIIGGNILRVARAAMDL